MFANFVSQFFVYDFMSVIWTGAGIIILALLYILVRTPETAAEKIVLFWVIVLPAVFTTLYLAGGTIHDNLTSATGGPVHWHADFRIFNCGQELDLVDPTGLSNRVGSPEIHEHNDFRIHVEGVLTEFREASLANFFRLIGGNLDSKGLAVPTNDGIVRMINGENCPDGPAGRLQVFLWETVGQEARQRKIFDYPEYVMSPESLIPPGDCVIFEFGPEKERTKYVCEQYQVAEKRGDIRIIF